MLPRQVPAPATSDILAGKTRSRPAENADDASKEYTMEGPYLSVIKQQAHLSTNDSSTTPPSQPPKVVSQLSIKLKREFKRFSKTLNSLSFFLQQQKSGRDRLEDNPSFFFDSRGATEPLAALSLQDIKSS